MEVIFAISLLTANHLDANQEEGYMDLWEAESYDENTQLQYAIASNFLTLLQEKYSLSSNAIVLDIGCGNGRITSSILEKYPHVQILGIDSSVDMIRFASQHFANGQMQFVVDRAEELKTVQPQSVDAIMSFSCLHWVMDQKSAYQSMYKALKPEGWMGLMFAAQTESDDPLDHAYAQAIHEDPWQEYFFCDTTEVDWNFAKPEQIERELKESGFEVIYIGTQDFEHQFENVDRFKNWVLACAQQLKLLPVELRESCAERIASLYLQATNFQPKSGECIYRFDPFMVIAKKSRPANCEPILLKSD
ncbi:MAG: methyltransferase domain-containing protein [Chlamydiales bacterium]|nr:methyltransferase domain-containing protein [Chlamydiia bacterium]MCP5507774.1 methyltransferase domain-containing protein [Chlamydiales bacterium]